MRTLLFIVITVLAFILVGCGGGGGTGPSNQPSVTTTIGGDAAIVNTSNTRGDVVPSAPLGPNSQVLAYDFSNGQLVWSGVTDATGMCQFPVTPGITLAVVFTGTNAGKNYRLSRIIPSVPIDGGRFIADPCSSMAAEAIALQHFCRTAIDQDTLDTVMQKVREFTAAHVEADYAVGEGIFGTMGFGQTGSINTILLNDIVSAVPAQINNKVVMGKNAVQQIRDAGISLTSMLEQERPDINSTIAVATGGQYRALVDRLHTVLLPAMFGGMEYTDSEGDLTWPTIFNLQLGKAYNLRRVESGDQGWSDSWFELTDSPDANVADQINIVYNTEPGISPSGAYSISVRRSDHAWLITQTFTGDPQQTYGVAIPDPGADPGAGPTIPVAISLKDAEFPTPLTFDGAITATGPDRGSYTKVALDGKLTTNEIAASGKLQMEFPSEAPAGADPDNQSIYDFPTGFSINNADVKINDGIATISVTGSAAVVMTVIDMGKGPRVAPSHVETTGTYNNSHTGLTFDGKITGDWSNASTTDLSAAKGTAHLVGTMTNTGHPSYSTDLTFALDSGTSTADISLHAGAASLTGKGTGTLSSDGKLQTASLNLTNQSGVVTSLAMDGSGNITGTVTVGGEIVGDVGMNGKLLRFTYRSQPATFDEFPIGWK